MSEDCVQNDSYSPFMLEFYKMKFWARKEKVPVSMTWELTPFCNLNCPMCYVHLTPAMARLKGKIMTAAQWLEIGRQFTEMGLFALNISGGEPLLHPEFWEIYEGMCRMGVFVSVFSNGYLIDEKAVERFKQYPPRQIKISLYGGCDETYETMCGVKNGFTRVSHALDLLKEAGIPVLLTTTLVKQNENDFPLMAKLADEKQIYLHGSYEISNTARGAASDPLSARVEHKRIMNMSLDQLTQMKHKPKEKTFDVCGTYGSGGMITWHGHLQVCNFFENEFIQLTEPFDIPAAWKAMNVQADSLKLPTECIGCPDAEFCMACPGAMTGGSGSPEHIDPYLCAEAALAHRRYDELMAEKASEEGKT